MRTRKRIKAKDWLTSVLVVFMLISMLALPIKLFSNNSGSNNNSSGNSSNDTPVEYVDVEGIELNKTEITF